MTELATFLQIDLQSLFGPLNRKKMDFDKIWEHFNGRETEFLTGTFIYTIKNLDFDSTRFEQKLKSIGYDLRIKTLPRASGRYRGDNNTAAPINHNLNLTIDCMSHIDRFDKVILMTNNGVFGDLCKFLKEKGKKIELWSFSDNYDPSLELYADKLHFIDDTFCMQKPSISVFGANWGLEKFHSLFDSTTSYV